MSAASRFAGAACTLAGAAIVVWLTVLIYRGSPADEAIMVALGIPVLMLIGWSGLALVMGGAVWLVARRR
jgi:hypothetical protein